MRWQYYIWLIAVLRLLVPFSGEMNLVGRAFAKWEARTEWERMDRQEPLLDSIDEIPKNLQTELIPTWENTSDTNDTRNIKISSDTREQNFLVKNLTKYLAMIWLAVACLLFAHKITVYQSFANYIRASSHVANIDLLERFGKIAEAMHIKGNVELYINEWVSSPLLIGFFRPKVILPTAELSEQDFYYTMVHELTHHQRKDLLYKWLVQFTICLHWLNPLVYLMGREINRTCELSCDEEVIRRLKEEEKRAYGDTLLRAAKVGGTRKTLLGTVTMHESKQLLKERLTSILEYKNRSRWVKAVSLLLTVVMISTALALGAYAKPTEEKATLTSGGDDFLLSDGTQVIERDQIYYLLCDGVTEEEVPAGGVLEGILITVVHKDSYLSVLLSEDIEEWKEEAEEICKKMQKNEQMTKQDAKLVMETVEALQNRDTYMPEKEDTNYYYYQSAYYQDGYLFFVAYDLAEEKVPDYEGREITLQDGENFYVSFADADQAWMENPEFLQALSELFSEFRQKIGKRVSKIKRPLVSYVEYVGSNIEALTEKYYKEEDIARFSVLFLELDQEQKKAYMEKVFQKTNEAIFSIILDDLDQNDELDEATLDTCIERAYRSGNVSYFAISVEYLSEEARKSWQERLFEEKASLYLSLLEEGYDWEDW